MFVNQETQVHFCTAKVLGVLLKFKPFGFSRGTLGTKIQQLTEHSAAPYLHYGQHTHTLYSPEKYFIFFHRNSGVC